MRSIPDSTKKECARRFKVNASARSLESRYILCAGIYISLLRGKNSADKDMVAKINEWAPVCRTLKGAIEFKHHIMKLSESSMVVTSTIHRAKGLEWDYVLIVGVTEGSLPVFMSQSDEEIKEERNLMYVTATRAKRSLFMYHAPYHHAKSGTTHKKLRQFLLNASVRKCFAKTTCG